MKKKVFLAGMLGIALALGMVLVGCDDNTCSNNGKCKAPGTTCGADSCAVKSYNTSPVSCDCD